MKPESPQPSAAASLAFVSRPIMGERCKRHGNALLGISEVLEAVDGRECLPCPHCMVEAHGRSVRIGLVTKGDDVLALEVTEVLWEAYDVASFLGADGVHVILGGKGHGGKPDEPGATGADLAWRVVHHQGPFAEVEELAQACFKALGPSPLVPREPSAFRQIG